MMTIFLLRALKGEAMTALGSLNREDLNFSVTAAGVIEMGRGICRNRKTVETGRGSKWEEDER